MVPPNFVQVYTLDIVRAYSRYYFPFNSGNSVKTYSHKAFSLQLRGYLHYILHGKFPPSFPLFISVCNYSSSSKPLLISLNIYYQHYYIMSTPLNNFYKYIICKLTININITNPCLIFSPSFFNDKI